jgi:hypothetical protein
VCLNNNKKRNHCWFYMATLFTATYIAQQHKSLLRLHGKYVHAKEPECFALRTFPVLFVTLQCGHTTHRMKITDINGTIIYIYIYIYIYIHTKLSCQLLRSRV